MAYGNDIIRNRLTGDLMTVEAIKTDPAHQVRYWELMCDWWRGDIVPWIKDLSRAVHAARMLLEWRIKLDAESPEQTH